jgi:hypothetical protein
MSILVLMSQNRPYVRQRKINRIAASSGENSPPRHYDPGTLLISFATVPFPQDPIFSSVVYRMPFIVWVPIGKDENRRATAFASDLWHFFALEREIT